MDPVRQIADAVLYEGYILWPYRRSALKNRTRWTFGGVYPRGHSEGRVDDPCRMRTECLLRGGDGATVDVTVRFLQVVRRQVLRAGPAGLEPVDELTVAGERHVSWEEAVEREVAVAAEPVGRLAARPRRAAIEIAAGHEDEELHSDEGQPGGAIVRSWHGLHGTVDVGAQRLQPDLFRVSVEVKNATEWHGGPRAEAVERTFCSTHAVLRTAGGGRFESLTDPGDDVRADAEACRNEGAWPVLVGELGARDTVLASPIILEDHPRIAPESPGDLFDGGEIDQLLTLNILSLTDVEKAEMRASDPRAREILERTEGLSEADLMRLHGAIRDFQRVRR